VPFENTSQLFFIILSHLVVALAERLIIGEMDLDGLVRVMPGPVIIIFVLDEVVDIKGMSKIDEAVSLPCLFRHGFVLRVLQLVEPIVMLQLEVFPYFVLLVLAWDVLHHQVCSYLFSLGNEVNVHWASVVLAQTGVNRHALARLLLLQLFIHVVHLAFAPSSVVDSS